MFSSKFQYRMAILGEPHVGKTCILNQLVRKKFSARYVPTLETDMEYIHEYNGSTYVCLIVDTAGERIFPAMRRLSITRSNGFLVVFDLSDAKSFEKAKKTCEEVKSYKQNECINIMLVGNKRDLLRNETEVTDLAGELIAELDEDKFIHCKYLEVSASDNDDITGLFENLLDMLDVIHLTKDTHNISNAAHIRTCNNRIPKSDIEINVTTQPTTDESNQQSTNLEKCDTSPRIRSKSTESINMSDYNSNRQEDEKENAKKRFSLASKDVEKVKADKKKRFSLPFGKNNSTPSSPIQPIKPIKRSSSTSAPRRKLSGLNGASENQLRPPENF